LLANCSICLPNRLRTPGFILMDIKEINIDLQFSFWGKDDAVIGFLTDLLGLCISMDVKVILRIKSQLVRKQIVHMHTYSRNHGSMNWSIKISTPSGMLRHMRSWIRLRTHPMVSWIPCDYITPNNIHSVDTCLSFCCSLHHNVHIKLNRYFKPHTKRNTPNWKLHNRSIGDHVHHLIHSDTPRRCCLNINPKACIECPVCKTCLYELKFEVVDLDSKQPFCLKPDVAVITCYTDYTIWVDINWGNGFCTL
jgi:hypothetical protein